MQPTALPPLSPAWPATEGVEGTNLGTTTSRDPQYKAGDYINFSQHQAYGSGRWSTSWLRQVLNSSDAEVQFVPATPWSRPGSKAEGFLHSLDPELVKALGKDPQALCAIHYGRIRL